MDKQPRKPGSQVAPGQKPFHRDGTTASTHSKVPIAEATAGMLFRVRDRDWKKVWDENLTYDDAMLLKERLVGQRKSKTARVESMAVAPPDWYAAQQQDIVITTDPDVTPDALPPVPPPPIAADDDTPRTHLPHEYLVEAVDETITVDTPVIIESVSGAFEVVVNGHVRPLPTKLLAGDTFTIHRVDAVLAAARSRAGQAVKQTLPPASTLRPPGKPYRDRTVTAPPPRNVNPPRDKTVSKDPVFVRREPVVQPEIKPPVSPLKVATMTDGKPVPENAITDDDLSDLLPDIGGGASDADIAHAEKQRDGVK